MFFPYKDVDSGIHRLDPRPKIVFVAVVFLLSILLSDILYLSFLLLIVLVVAWRGKVLDSTMGLLKYALVIGVFILLFNVLISKGSTVLFQWGPLMIMMESTAFAFSMVVRLFLAMASFSVLTFAVHPDDLLRTLSRVGHKVMTGLSLATRMYPTIAADSGAVMDSMRARGVEMDRGNAVEKARARAPVLMPLLLNSLDRSIGISEAMEARGFGSGRARSSYCYRPMDGWEWTIIAMSLGAMVLGIVSVVMGYGALEYDSLFRYGWEDMVVLSLYAVLLTPICWGARG